jgi:hypothetical protein
MKTSVLTNCVLIAALPLQVMAQNTTYPILEFKVEKIQLAMPNAQAAPALARRISDNPQYENYFVRENQQIENAPIRFESPFDVVQGSTTGVSPPPLAFSPFELSAEPRIGLVDISGDKSLYACLLSPQINLKSFVDEGGTLLIFGVGWDKVAVFGRKEGRTHEAAHVVQQRAGINTIRSNFKGGAAQDIGVNEPGVNRQTKGKNQSARVAASPAMNSNTGSNPLAGQMNLRNLEFRVINRIMAMNTGGRIMGYMDGEMEIDRVWHRVRLEGSFVQVKE